MTWLRIADNEALGKYGAILWLDPDSDTLHFDSYYDGNFQGPELDIPLADLLEKVKRAKETSTV